MIQTSKEVYYIDEEHKKLTQEFLSCFHLTDVYENREIGGFCYLMGASGKEELLPFCSENGVSSKKILEYRNHSLTYSSTERNLVLLALHIFQPQTVDTKEITIDNLFKGLGSDYRKIIYQSLEIRYGIYS